MFIKTFTDPQGTTHTDAVFETANAQYNEYNSTDYVFEFSQGDLESSKNSNSQGNMTLNFTMYYWCSESSRAEGKFPYILANTETIGQTFNVDNARLSEWASLGLSPQELAEKYVNEVILA